MSAEPSVSGAPLPLLREDLQLEKGPIGADGAYTWNIYDPVRNKFFRIGWAAFQLISRWSEASVGGLVDRVTRETTANVTEADVFELIKFLQSQSLTRDSASGNSHDYVEQYEATRVHWLLWLIKNYLFVRIPLLHPDRFLGKSLPLVELFYTRTFRNAVLAGGLIGLYLVFRQWEIFFGTFLYFFNPQGFLFYFFALVVLKIFHELGHAYTAKRYGCKIPTMGVALLVMFPVLYTDTTDAWRVISRKQRLYIGSAGMIAELYIALIATFVWSFLPDGLFRSVAFIFATTSWVTSILINLNVFMRFDGYYLLSDYWGIENLQGRAFAFGKWRLRELLFNFGLRPPEQMPAAMRRKLTLYAWGVWVYRFFLFLGIALLVYHLFFKLLGIILFAIEIAWFILVPIKNELKVWWGMRDMIKKSNRLIYLLAGSLLLLALLFIPFSTKIPVPAIMQAAQQAKVHASSPGRIKEVVVAKGDTVTQQQILLIIESPFLDDQINRTKKELSLVELRLRRYAANPEDLEDISVLRNQLQELRSKLNGLNVLKSELTIRAPMRGKVVDLAENLHPGRWINEKLEIALIILPDDLELTGIISDKDLGRVKKDQQAVFVPDEAELGEVKSEVIDIEQANLRYLYDYYLASTYQGSIPVRKDENQRLVPEEASYRIKLFPYNNYESHNKVTKGRLYIDGEARSFASRLYNHVASILVRESGF